VRSKTARSGPIALTRPALRLALAGSSSRRARWTRGYDNSRVYAECEDRGCEPVIPLRGMNKSKQPGLPLAVGGRLFPHPPSHRRLEAPLPWPRSRRALFGDLKNHYGLAPLRVRGRERVALHADLVMLARLSQVLSRARAVPLAA
jgi:hypothetical protein